MEDRATQFLAWMITDASAQTESWEKDIILNKLQTSLIENQSTFQRLAHENNALKQLLIEERAESGWLRLTAQQKLRLMWKQEHNLYHNALVL